MLTSDKVDMDCLPSGTVTLEQKVFDLEKLLDEVKQWAIPLAAERDVLFSSETIKAEHVKLYGSPVHLKKILTKIVGNAIKDSLSGEQVTFFAERPEQVEEKPVLNLYAQILEVPAGKMNRDLQWLWN